MQISVCSSEKRSEQGTTQRISQPTRIIVDNRPQTIVQRQIQTIIDERSTYLFPVNKLPVSTEVTQFARLKAVSERLKKGHKKTSTIRRAARTLRMERKILGKWTKRNLLHATIKHEGFSFTFHLQSAGMGGRHPKFSGKSAAHTEQQFRALVKGNNGVIKKYINGILKKYKLKELKQTDSLNTRSIFSTNQACDKNSSMPHGCESIDTGDMSMTGGRMFYAVDYHTGGHKGTTTHYQLKETYEKELRNRGVSRLRRSNSFDLLVDSDSLRGVDLKNLSHNAFSNIVSVDPETDKALII